MIHPNFVIVGVILQSIGGLSYLIDTLKGNIQPNKVSWLLWAIAPLIAFAAQLSQGVGIVSLTTFIVGFVPLVIFVASFTNKKAQWQLGHLDVLCGILSLVGIIFWYITKVGNVAIFFSIVADGLAAVPTIVKSYKHPESENDTVYLFAIVNAVIGLFVIQTWNFAYWGFPVYLLITNFLLFLLIRYKLGNIILLRQK